MNKLYNEYHKAYKKIYPNGNINSKDYTNTLIRNIIIYFLYKHYKHKIIKRSHLTLKFNIKHVNSVYQKIVEIERYKKNTNELMNKKDIFIYFYYIFYKVYIKIKKNEKT